MHLGLLPATASAAQSEDRSANQKTTFFDSIDPMRSFPRSNRHSKPDIRPGGQSTLAEVGRLRFRLPIRAHVGRSTKEVRFSKLDINVGWEGQRYSSIPAEFLLTVPGTKTARLQLKAVRLFVLRLI
jgi:hypothetical protein